jgi:hypothetical protein
MASQQLFHKTRAQLRPWDTNDLQAPDDALHALLEERTREDAAPLPVTPGRTVVATRRQGAVTLRLEYVRSGKASYHCAQDQVHGHYWYACSRKAGRVTSAYIGKNVGKITLGSP